MLASTGKGRNDRHYVKEPIFAISDSSDQLIIAELGWGRR